MILSLRVHNLALIDTLELPFFEGMHVLTGETGAGKSIVVDSVNLVLGGRAERELIRTGTDRAWVEADFDISGLDDVRRMLESEHIDPEGNTLTLRREITRSGRNLCRIAGVTMPLSYLRELAALLMDVHGQHEHQFLTDPERQLAFLDACGDDAHADLLTKTSEAAETFLTCHRAYGKLVKENNEKHARMEELDRSLKELNKARLKPGEEESLTAERDRFRHAEKIIGSVSAARDALSTGDVGEGAVSLLRSLADAMRPLTDMGMPYSGFAERGSSLFYEAEELERDLTDLLEGGDFDPARMEQVETRLDLIRRLERKYGDTVEAVLNRQEQLQTEFDRLSALDDEVAAAGREHRRLLGAYRALAAELTASREKLAKSFSERMMEQLRELGMEKTVFSVAFAEKPEEKRRMPQPKGDDAITFMISPNPGEPLKPLDRIASGGELSRLMLAVKSIGAEREGTPTMVFDEIDTGISGRMAQVVGEKMARIALHRQVICVTHLPQIAAMASHAYLVEKSVTDGRTSTDVRLLEGGERCEELARLLGGADGSAAESALRHARHMLEEAEARRKGLA